MPIEQRHPIDMEIESYTEKKIKEGFIGQRMIVLPPNIENAISKNPLTEGFHLTAIGFYPHAAFHDRERKSGSPQYILLYCIEGEGYLSVGNKRHVLSPNNFFIIPRNVPHHYHSAPTNSWSIYWAHFSGGYADEIYARYAPNHEPEVALIPYDEKQIDIFNRVITLLESGFGERDIEIANFNFLHFLTTFVYYEEVNPITYAEDPVSDSIKYMKEHLSCSFTIKELASGQNLSISYYSDLFKKKMGYSPIQFFIQLKIQRSCQYLYFTNKSIKEICSELGFKDPFYFSRIFKKTMGLSPAKYRSMHKVELQQICRKLL